MWTREILDYIEYNKWKDELVPERLKCFFTTWAYEYRIGKDQDECESLLKRIYENAGSRIYGLRRVQGIHASVCEVGLHRGVEIIDSPIELTDR